MTALLTPPAGSDPVAAPTADLSPLDDKDLILLRLLARGLPTGAIARRLDTSERTIRRRMRAICDRLGVPAPVSAAVWAARRGLL